MIIPDTDNLLTHTRNYSYAVFSIRPFILFRSPVSSRRAEFFQHHEVRNNRVNAGLSVSRLPLCFSRAGFWRSKDGFIRYRVNL